MQGGTNVAELTMMSLESVSPLPFPIRSLSWNSDARESDDGIRLGWLCVNVAANRTMAEGQTGRKKLFQISTKRSIYFSVGLVQSNCSPILVIFVYTVSIAAKMFARTRFT